MIRIEVPRRWFDEFTIPCDFMRPLRPDQFIIEDDEMEAEAILIVGWIVFPEQGNVHEYIVGTVIRQRINDEIKELSPPSHGHVYLKTLPGRRVVSVERYDQPYEVVIVEEHGARCGCGRWFKNKSGLIAHQRSCKSRPFM